TPSPSIAHVSPALTTARSTNTDGSYTWAGSVIVRTASSVLPSSSVTVTVNSPASVPSGTVHGVVKLPSSSVTTSSMEPTVSPSASVMSIVTGDSGTNPSPPTVTSSPASASEGSTETEGS